VDPTKAGTIITGIAQPVDPGWSRPSAIGELSARKRHNLLDPRQTLKAWSEIEFARSSELSLASSMGPL
jgi:hypothetical protein